MLTHFTICGLLIIIFRFIRRRTQPKYYDLAEDKEPWLLDSNGDEVANGNIHSGKQPFFGVHFSDN